MGGRGKLSPLGTDIGFFEQRNKNAKGKDMDLAPLNPQAAYRTVSPSVSLGYVEGQTSTLKHERLFVMGEHGYIVSAVDGIKGAVKITPGALRNLKGNVVTHNHPRDDSRLNGGTFSMADIKSLRYGAREFRAVAKEGTYSMKAGKEANPEGLHGALINDKSPIVQKQRQIASQVQRAYDNGRYKTEQEAKIDSFNRQMEVVNHWYENNAQKYGYSYSFTPDSQRTPVHIETPKRRTQKQIDRDKKGVDYGKQQAKKTLDMAGKIDVKAFMSQREVSLKAAEQRAIKMEAIKRRNTKINSKYEIEEQRSNSQLAKDKKGIDYGKQRAKETIEMAGRIDVEAFFKNLK